MEFESSSLSREVDAIIRSGVKPVHYTWSAVIHTPEGDFPAMKVLQIDRLRDFENNFGPVVMATLVLGLGTYAKRIWPQTNLEITLTRRPLAEVGDTVMLNNTAASERFDAVMDESFRSPIVEGNTFNVPDEDTLNRTNMIEVPFQLVNKSLGRLRMMTVGATYRNTTGEIATRLMLTREAKSLQIDSTLILKGVEMTPAANQAQRDHVVIPPGTPLYSVPHHVHTKCGGLYSAGIGSYYEGDYWYIWPVYDTERWEQAPGRRLTVINVPKNKYPKIERSYMVEGSVITIMANGNVTFQSDTESKQLNEGNGVMFANADDLENNFVQVSGNRAVASRGRSNNEFLAQQRENGLNNIQRSTNPINANPYLEYSKLARRRGEVLNVEWENSDPTLIEPGMAARMLYLEGSNLREIRGLVLKAAEFTRLAGEGMTSTRFITTTVVSLFMSPEQF